MKLNSYNFLLGLAFASTVVAPATQAEIVIHGTRVIYPSDAREVTLQVSNNGSKPALVQAWIDEGDPKSTPDQSKSPRPRYSRHVFIPLPIAPPYRVLLRSIPILSM